MIDSFSLCAMYNGRNWLHATNISRKSDLISAQADAMAQSSRHVLGLLHPLFESRGSVGLLICDEVSNVRQQELY